MNVLQIVLARQDVAKGGQWLANVREFMKRRIRKADTLCWNDAATPVYVTMHQLEELVMEAAAQAVAQERTFKEQPK